MKCFGLDIPFVVDARAAVMMGAYLARVGVRAISILLIGAKYYGANELRRTLPVSTHSRR